jgi:N-acetylglucosamine-6-phosphate deacetylase
VFRIDVVAACRMLATTPARIARIGDRVGSIAVGCKANLLVVSSAVEEINRRMVYGVWADDESHGPYRMLRPSVPSAL